MPKFHVVIKALKQQAPGIFIVEMATCPGLVRRELRIEAALVYKLMESRGIVDQI